MKYRQWKGHVHQTPLTLRRCALPRVSIAHVIFQNGTPRFVHAASSFAQTKPCVFVKHDDSSAPSTMVLVMRISSADQRRRLAVKSCRSCRQMIIGGSFVLLRWGRGSKCNATQHTMPRADHGRSSMMYEAYVRLTGGRQNTPVCPMVYTVLNTIGFRVARVTDAHSTE